MKPIYKKIHLLLLAIIFHSLYLPAVIAAESENENAATASEEQKTEPEVESVEVEKIKEKYWARGDESELGVVQNRLFSKAKKWSLGMFGGIISSDPFLDTKMLGLSIGYHFNEYYALNVVAWKSFVQSSDALKTFEKTRGATANTNKAEAYFGVEGLMSILYGKLSLVGKKIIYYDLHLLAGLGATKTESGTDPTASIGIGQRFYLSKNMSLRFDYRYMAYRERILEKEIPTKIGNYLGSRTNFTSAFTLGLEFLFGAGKGK